MKFHEKLQLLRKRAGLSQVELSEKLGVTRRAVVYLENAERKPSGELLNKITTLFEVDNSLMLDDNREVYPTKEEMFLEVAQKELGDKAKSEAKKYLEKSHALFAGGTFSDEDKDTLFEVLTEIYFDAKKKTKRYGERKNTGAKKPTVP